MKIQEVEIPRDSRDVRRKTPSTEQRSAAMAALTPLLILPLIICTVGDVEIEKLRINGATGSSILLPGLKSEVEFKENMIYELRKVGGNPSWLMMAHGEPIVHKAYETRGQVVSENKSFLLTNLTEKDNGVYEQKLNQKTLLLVILTVIDPVEDPVLRRQDEDNVTCRFSLLCDAGISDSSNTTFRLNGEEIKWNTSWIGSDNHLFVDGTDPQYWGIYTCTVKNLVSQKDSQEMEFIPERMSGGSPFFFISCIGGFIYVFHLLCLLVTIKPGNAARLQNVLLYIKCIGGTGMELIAFSIIAFMSHLSNYQPFMIGEIIVLFVVLMVRALWVYILCGLHLHALIIMAMEDTLLVADILLVPAIYIQYIRLYIEGASDLCGLRKEQILQTLLHLVIGFVILLAVVLPLRILWVKCRASDPPGAPESHKGLFIPAPTGDETVNNKDGRKNEETEKETQSLKDEIST
ncbi:uncharacterized protein ACNLHF_006377 [Anomaloglossus baeobatrachus]|uniref:uncharacterized protein LOC142269949 n=1 Tax=Anomaloglossus baeobatrachus TaxID=238106 RepID=UPI003F4F431B